MKRAICLAGFFAAAAAAARAQAVAPGKPSPTPRTEAMPPVSEITRVDITNVEVVVTDSKGNRVSGLTKEDFEIRQDGLPQTVTNFYTVEGTKVTLEDGKTIRLDSPEAKDEAPPDVKARYVIFIDNLNIQPQNRNRMFKSLKEFVAQTVGKSAEAEVITYNRSLKIKQKFTSEAGPVVGTLEDIERETGGGSSLASDRRDALQRIDEARSPAEALDTARTFSRSLRNDIEFAVDAIKNTLNSLGGLTGRKVFVYVSEGLPATAGLELYDVIQNKFRETTSTLEQFEFDMNAKYSSIVQAANAQGVTIWALDASGLATDQFVSAENRYMQSRPSDLLLRQNTQAPLRMMAEETGGLAAVNTNDWKKSLDELARDFTSFYSLGFRTAGAAVDKPHRIEVSVKRKGLSVRYRKGLLEKTPETRVAETLFSALEYPREENPLAISVSLDPPKPQQKDNYVLPLHIFLPIGKLGLLPTRCISRQGTGGVDCQNGNEDCYKGSYRVYILVRDSSLDLSDLASSDGAICVPAKELQRAQTKDQPYELKLVVRAGAQRLSLAVRDLVTEQVSYFQKNFFVSMLPPEKKKQ